MHLPEVVSPEEWLAARRELLAKEKELRVGVGTGAYNALDGLLAARYDGGGGDERRGGGPIPESDLDLDSLNLGVPGHQEPVDLTVQMGAGDTTVDLTGDYTKPFPHIDASIQGGVGEATVLLPRMVGVKVKAQGGLGKIDAKGLQRVDDAYVNDAYGESEVTLRVDIEGGFREINLEVV
jgi:Cell wall-active antibiotics response 4TMS YvqF